MTFNEYDAYCEATSRVKISDYVITAGYHMGKGNKPVIHVSWYDAIKYCNWLSQKEGLAKAYDSEGNLLDKNGRRTTDITKVEGYRLPTEAEWEYAARGGHKSTIDYRYAGSNNIGEVGWYKDNSNNKTHEVGQKMPNELGLYDMSGNVWEWCQGWYGEYTTNTNPIGPGAHDRNVRVIRGGSFTNEPIRCLVTYLNGCEIDNSHGDVGFRITRTCD